MKRPSHLLCACSLFLLAACAAASREASADTTTVSKAPPGTRIKTFMKAEIHQPGMKTYFQRKEAASYF